MPEFLPQIPRLLDRSNIDTAIETYLSLLEDIPTHIEAEDILTFMKTLKRKELNTGPYPNVTLFEAANRIMTDLTILYGVKMLLDREVEGINFSSYTVEYGNENKHEYDITVKNKEDGYELIGEAFNVSKSFFQGKKYAMLKKLRGHNDEKAVKLLLYNADAVNENYIPKVMDNEVFVPVIIKL